MLSLRDSPDEPEGNKVVSNQLIVILAGLLKPEKEHNQLLTPIRGLHEIVGLQFWLHVPVRVVCRGMLAWGTRL